MEELDGTPVRPFLSNTILLVDDSDLIRSLVKEILETDGFRVLDASDGAAALQLARSAGEPLELLITDLGLPGMNGVELSRQMRNSFPRLKTVLLSADPGNAKASELIPSAVFLDKNRVVEELTGAVRELLNGDR